MKMNTSYDELDTDIEQQLPKEEHKWEERCETCNRSCKRFIQEKSTPLKWLFIFVVFISMICLYVTYFIELIECRSDGYCKYHEQHDHYLKENYNKTKHRRLTVAGIIHHNRHRKTCDDYEFGCCEIYTGCNYNETDFTSYHTYRLHGIPKHNKEGTNCPRLDDLVSEHNYHYPLPEGENCEDSIKGCYKIETECDIRIRYLDVEDGFKDDIELYKKNIHMGYKYTNLVERTGIDAEPSIYELMYEYRSKYPSRGAEVSIFIVFIVILLVLLVCVSNNK